MWLINTSTYKLEEQVTPAPYAILSHTWTQGEELNHSEFRRKRGKRKRGYQKIVNLCTQARADGFQYAWIDTVCIDKSSSAELSEAINSMFAWYGEAQVCYVFLEDTDDVANIEHSRWITRGWTLQELLAPSVVRFYNRSWTLLGTKASLVPNLVRWTRIDQIALEDPSMTMEISVAARMSWAASRRTSRVEDMAYCLLGIFGVTMPLIYGEKTKAFRRLQEEILRQSHDISLLAFDRLSYAHHERNLLALDPDIFGKRPRVINENHNTYCEVTSIGLETSLQVLKFSEDQYLGILPCRFEFDLEGLIALQLYSVRSEGASKYCIKDTAVIISCKEEVQNLPYEVVTLMEKIPPADESFGLLEYRYVCRLSVSALISHGYEVIYAEPEVGINSWNEASLTSEIVTIGDVVPVRKFGFIHRAHREAFIIMLASVRISLGDDVYLCAKTKPKDLDCQFWLEAQGMYGTIKKQTMSSWSGTRPFETDEVIVVGNETWERVYGQGWDDTPEVKIFNPLHLSSDSCFSELALTVEASDYQSVWTICIEPGSHKH